ncbi:hypothetical protein RB195_021283 [Necator americanus]|uniref:Peptidase S1 domain-containing protein n=1 Tax=Necator americanus TaxID=51031 RepID=A0ABR1EA75_NECAM
MIILWLIGFSLVYAHHIEKSFFKRHENKCLQKQCGYYRLPGASDGRSPQITMFRKLVKPNEYPFAVHIDTKYKTCTGVLISENHVLTAAHCLVQAEDEEEKKRLCEQGHWNADRVDRFILEPMEMRIYPGSRCPKPESCKPGRKEYKSDLALPHPEYNICNGANDIGLIKLYEHVSKNDGAPICLPEKEEKLSIFVSAVGYGNPRHTEFRRKAELGVVSFWNYTEKYGGIVTYSRIGNSCLGDRGGPLFHSNKGALTLVGIAYGTTPDCSKKTRESGRFYTDVRKYLDWICEESDVCPNNDEDETGPGDGNDTNHLGKQDDTEEAEETEH